MPPLIRRRVLRRLFLQEWREARGLTQKQVADRLEIDSQTISRWERWAQGKRTERKPDLDDIQALAHAYDIEPEDFYHSPDKPTPNALLRDQPADVLDQAIRLIQAIRKAS